LRDSVLCMRVHRLMRGELQAMAERTTEMTRLKGFSYDQHASVSLGPLKWNRILPRFEPCSSVLRRSY
jgi:hypothetical protein